jgi:uncharacterized protein YycO
MHEKMISSHKQVKSQQHSDFYIFLYIQSQVQVNSTYDKIRVETQLVWAIFKVQVPITLDNHPFQKVPLNCGSKVMKCMLQNFDSLHSFV